MQISPLSLEGALLIRPRVFQDARGFFYESYQWDRYAAAGISVSFVQDNQSRSIRNTVRGMHFQSYPGQAKLVSVLQGEILDVIVDIRPESRTFGQWLAVPLRAEDFSQLYIPIGFAHGFCVLSEQARLFYKVSSPYCSQTEQGFRWNDPSIGIDWPTDSPLVSRRDREAPLFHEIDFRAERDALCSS